MGEEASQPEAATRGPELPPLSILEGLIPDDNGQIIHNGITVGVIVDGDLKRIRKAGTACDAKGQIWTRLGTRVLGTAQTVSPRSTTSPQIEDTIEIRENAQPIYGQLSLECLAGRAIDAEGKIRNDDGIIIGEVHDGDIGRIHRFSYTPNDNGEVRNKKGKILGHVRAVSFETGKDTPTISTDENTVCDQAQPDTAQDEAFQSRHDEVAIDVAIEEVTTACSEESEPFAVEPGLEIEVSSWGEWNKIPTPQLTLPEKGSATCAYLATHLSDSGAWKSCTSCRTMILQLSDELARQEGSS